LLGSPGAKGQQSSAGDSEKDQCPRADMMNRRSRSRRIIRKIKKFVVADVGGYGNKDLYQVSLETEFLFSFPLTAVQSLSRWPERPFD